MSLKTHANITRWVIIATDATGQRGFFTSHVWWKGERRVANDIRFAMLLATKEQAQHVVKQWSSTQIHGIEYVPVNMHINLKKGGKSHGRHAQN